MQINSETWTKDAFELIDYENEYLIPYSFETRESGFLVRNNNSIQFLKELIQDEQAKKLFEIKSHPDSFEIFPNSYIIDNNEENDSKFKGENSCWFIYKKSKTNDKQKKYKINEGDIIKIGRITGRIREIKTNDNINNFIKKKNINLNSKNNQNDNKEKKINQIKTKKKKICKICYSEDDYDDNPLIQPCTCSGTMRYIHLDCLKHWIGTKSCVKIESNDNYTIYKIKKIQCELCKTILPDYIKHNNKIYCVLEYNTNYKNYICIERLTVDKRKNRYFYIGNIDNKKEIKVGRGHNVDLLLNDVSVSRIHFKLYIQDNGIFLEDNDSKFGSLILVQTQVLKISNSLPLFIQVGRTFLKIKLKYPFSIFSCCKVNENINEFYYQIQNEKKINYENNVYIKEENDDDDDIQSDIDIKSENAEINKIKNLNKNFSILKVIEDENDDKMYNDEVLPTIRLTTLGDMFEVNDLQNLKSNHNKKIDINDINININKEKSENG